jgi:hypothetical protein
MQPGYRQPDPTDVAAAFASSSQPVHPSFITLVTLLLEYLRITTWSSQTSPEQAAEEWKSFDAVYTEGNKVWQGSPDSGWIGKGMRRMAENLLHLAFRVSRLSRELDGEVPMRFLRSLPRFHGTRGLRLPRYLLTGSGELSKSQRYQNGTISPICPKQAPSHSQSSSSAENPAPKRGDMTFALGNICWKVYDQVRCNSNPLGIQFTNCPPICYLAANISFTRYYFPDVFDDPTIPSSTIGCAMHLQSGSRRLLVLVWEAKVSQGRRSRGQSLVSKMCTE